MITIIIIIIIQFYYTYIRKMYFFSPSQQKWHFVLKFCIQVSRILFFSNLFEQKLFKCSEDPTRCGIERSHRSTAFACLTLPRYGSLAFPVSALCKPAPANVPAFTIWYRSIRSTSDIQLDIQKVSYFLLSTLVDQLYAQGVYFCIFVTKSNQACTKYSPKCIQKFL